MEIEPRPHFGPGITARDNAPVDLSRLQRGFKPKIVAVAGLPRTGSTTLTIIAQIWLLLADPNYVPFKRVRGGPTSEPWVGHVKSTVLYQLKWGRRKISQLVKMHDPVEWVEKVADVILMSHRDPVDEQVSIELSWGTVLQGNNHDKDCDRLMQKQRDHYKFAKDCCGGVGYDMQLEDLNDSPTQTLKDVGMALGIRRLAMTPAVLAYVQKLLDAHRPDDVEKGLPKGNQKWHTDEERRGIYDAVAEKMFQIPGCKEWADRHGAWEGGRGTGRGLPRDRSLK